MNIKLVREYLTEINKMDAKEVKALIEKACDKTVSDEELGRALQARITKIEQIGLFGV
jgi:hypothetical protein